MSMKQTQTLSPQMMQSMEILQMGSQELLEYIENQVQENPVLEMEEKYGSQDEAAVLQRKLEWLESTDTQNRVYHQQDTEDDGKDPISNYGNADEIVKYVPEEQIVLGTSGGGAIVAGPGHVLHRGQGGTHIGGMGKDQSRAEMVKRLMDEGGVPEVELVPNVLELVWSKLFVNIGINAICALTDGLNKTVVENEFAHKASYALVKEAVAVANAVGMDFDFEKEFKNVMDIAAVTGENVCSMLADVRHKRRTEVDRINGAAVSEGAKAGMAAPLNEFITNLIHAKELLY